MKKKFVVIDTPFPTLEEVRIQLGISKKRVAKIVAIVNSNRDNRKSK